MDAPSLILMSMLAFVASIVLIWGLAHVAEPLGLLDLPDARKRHGEPVPMVGGLALFLVVWGLSVGFGVFTWLVLCSAGLVLMGAIDDAVDLGVRIRLVGQVLFAVLMYLGSGVAVVSLGDYLSVQLTLGGLAPFVTLFAVVGLTNAFNMLDGMDGLAAGHAVVSLLTLIAASLITGALVHFGWLLGLLAAIGGFWLVNMRLIGVRRVFLGDAGSMLLGFLLAWLVIGYTQPPWDLLHPILALWCLTIPVFDTCAVISRRLRAGRSPFSPDRLHLHHVLLDLGLAPRHAVLVMLVGAFCVNALGLGTFWLLGPTAALTLFVTCFVGFVYLSLHPEVDRKLLVWVRGLKG